MKVDIIYRNATTRRNRKLKNVTLGSRRHARAIVESLPLGTPYPILPHHVPRATYDKKGHLTSGITHGMRDGFKIEPTNTRGTPTFRRDNIKKRSILGKEFFKDAKLFDLYGSEPRQRRPESRKFFRVTAKIYDKTTPDAKHRQTTELITWKGDLYVNIHADEEVVAPMSSLTKFRGITDKTIFNNQRARFIWTSGVPSDNVDPAKDEYDDLMMFLESYTTVQNNQFASWLTSYNSGGYDKCLVVFYIKDFRFQQGYQSVIPSFFNVEDQPHGRNQPLLDTPYIQYRINENVTTFTDMFTLRMIQDENACIYQGVYDHCDNDPSFKKKRPNVWNPMNADFKRYMWSINHPDEPYPAVLPMATLKEFYPVFDIIKKEVVVFDMRRKVWFRRLPRMMKFNHSTRKYEYVLTDSGEFIDIDPEDLAKDKNGRPTIYLISHNQHVYMVNRPHKATYAQEDEEYEHVIPEQPEPKLYQGSTDYRLPRDQEEAEKKEANEDKDADSNAYNPAPPEVLKTDDSTYPWYDQLATIVSSSREFNHYTFYLALPLFDAWFKLFKATGYEASLIASNKESCAGFNLSNLWRGLRQLHIRVLPYPYRLVKDVSPSHEEATKILRSLLEEETALKRRIITRSVMSYYAPETHAMFKHYKCGGIRGRFIKEWNIKFKQILGLDFCKFYPYIMTILPQIPVLSIFDLPQRYDGHELETCNFYEVEFLDYIEYEIETDDNTIYEVESTKMRYAYAYRKYHLCLGWTLQELPSSAYRIISFIRPSKLASNHYRAEVQALLQRTDLDIAVVKTLLAKLSGLTGISEYKRYACQVFLNEVEAGHYLAFDENTTTMIRRFEDNHGDISDVYALIQNRKTETHSGFMPVYHAIIDISMFLAWKLKNKLKGLGYRVLGMKTDNLYIDVDFNDDTTKLKLLEELGDMMCDHSIKNEEIRFTTSTLENFGRLKFEPTEFANKPPHLVTIKKNQYINSFNMSGLHYRNCPMLDEANYMVTCPCGNNVPYYHPPRLIQVDEWNEEAMFVVYDDLRTQGIPLQMLAHFAGSGKTTFCIRYAINRGLSVLALSFMNRKVCEMKQDFGDYPNAVCLTIDYLFESRADADLPEYDMVLVDEWATTPVPTATRLMKAVYSGNIKWLVVTSDVYQNPAINTEFNNIKDVQEYYNNLTDRLCPAKIVLKEPKRCRCPQHKTLYDLPTIRDCTHCEALRERWAYICNGIISAPTDEDARLFVIANFTHVMQLDDITNSNNITYFTKTRDFINDFCHRRLLAERGLPANTLYYKGQGLICDKKYRGKEVKLHANYDAEITNVNGKYVTLKEPLTGVEFIPSMNELQQLFRYNHAITCHSKQGSSVNDPVTIFNIFSKKVTKNWLLVAVTRNVDLSQTRIYMGKDLRHLEKTHGWVVKKIRDMIESHKRADKAKNLPFTNKEYITVDYVLELLERTQRCAVCTGETVGEDSFSIDRIDSEIAHIQGNIQILCSSKCNSQKKRRYISS